MRELRHLMAAVADDNDTVEVKKIHPGRCYMWVQFSLFPILFKFLKFNPFYFYF